MGGARSGATQGQEIEEYVPDELADARLTQCTVVNEVMTGHIRKQLLCEEKQVLYSFSKTPAADKLMYIQHIPLDVSPLQCKC